MATIITNNTQFSYTVETTCDICKTKIDIASAKPIVCGNNYYAQCCSTCISVVQNAINSRLK